MAKDQGGDRKRTSDKFREDSAEEPDGTTYTIGQAVRGSRFQRGRRARVIEMLALRAMELVWQFDYGVK